MRLSPTFVSAIRVPGSLGEARKSATSHGLSMIPAGLISGVTGGLNVCCLGLTPEHHRCGSRPQACGCQSRRPRSRGGFGADDPPIPTLPAKPGFFIAQVVGDSEASVEMRYEDENIWLTQKMMAALYDVTVSAINQHLKRLFSDNELEPAATVKKTLIVQTVGPANAYPNPVFIA